MLEQSAQGTISGLLKNVIRDAHLDLTFRCSRTTHHATACLEVEFQGSDTPALLHHHGELLLALEHLATQVLRLSPEEHEQISFDADGFKARRARALHRSASQAVAAVLASGKPFHFAPMSSRERRLLHLALAASGLPTLSEGEPPTRHLVLHPKP